MAEAKRFGHRRYLVSFMALLRSKDNIQIKHIRPRNLRYMLIFPLAPVFANMQGLLFQEPSGLFGLDPI